MEQRVALRFLRDAADDPVAWTLRAERLRRRLPSLRGEARVSLLGLLGDVERVRGELEAAEALLREAVERAGAAEDLGREASNRIRLAVVLQYGDRHGTALEELGRAEDALDRRGGDALRDFLHLARGKVLAELRRWDEAEAELGRALELRRASGDPRLIRGAAEALAALAGLRATSSTARES